jgi:RNase adaptor protein for sRNA GlmZ degradation
MHRIPIRIAAALAVLATLGATAHAQSTAGNIAGEAKAGDVIIVRGESNGFKREIKVDADGPYKVRRVPIGKYDIVLTSRDGKIETLTGIVVRPEGTTRISGAGEVKQDKDGFNQTDAY